jgi:hypothetical protein
MSKYSHRYTWNVARCFKFSGQRARSVRLHRKNDRISSRKFQIHVKIEAWRKRLEHDGWSMATEVSVELNGSSSSRSEATLISKALVVQRDISAIPE